MEIIPPCTFPYSAKPLFLFFVQFYHSGSPQNGTRFKIAHQSVKSRFNAFISTKNCKNNMFMF